MHVTNMNSPHTGKPVVNQYIITDGDTTVFQSYDSTIATIDREARTITLGGDWNRSVTTAKYRNLFFKGEDFNDLASKEGIIAALESGTVENIWGTVYTVTMWWDNI